MPNPMPHLLMALILHTTVSTVPPILHRQLAEIQAALSPTHRFQDLRVLYHSILHQVLSHFLQAVQEYIKLLIQKQSMVVPVAMMKI